MIWINILTVVFFNIDVSPFQILINFTQNWLNLLIFFIRITNWYYF